MNQEILANFGTAVHELFIRWDALKLAVEHMGGRNGQQVRRKIHLNALLDELLNTYFVYIIFRPPERSKITFSITVHKMTTFLSANW